jgi:hypothetical protein
MVLGRRGKVPASVSCGSSAPAFQTSSQMVDQASSDDHCRGLQKGRRHPAMQRRAETGCRSAFRRKESTAVSSSPRRSKRMPRKLRYRAHPSTSAARAAVAPFLDHLHGLWRAAAHDLRRPRGFDGEGAGRGGDRDWRGRHPTAVARTKATVRVMWWQTACAVSRWPGGRGRACSRCAGLSVAVAIGPEGWLITAAPRAGVHQGQRPRRPRITPALPDRRSGRSSVGHRDLGLARRRSGLEHACPSAPAWGIASMNSVAKDAVSCVMGRSFRPG